MNLILFLISATVLVLTVAIEKKLLPILKSKYKQPIYLDGPSWHEIKTGTPTMGGLAFLISISLSLVLYGSITFINGDRASAISIFFVLAYAILNSLIGIADDRAKIAKKQNAGLTPAQKLIFQIIFSAVFVIAFQLYFHSDNSFFIVDKEINLGILFYPLTILFLVGLTNFANLTDGVDGLASSTTLTVSASLFFLYHEISTGITIISISLTFAMLGFLIFNVHPAKIFMGDTGSLFIGALLSSTILITRNPAQLLSLCVIFLIDGLSVILQVVSYKITGKRIFKMAPLHHHLERSGWSENKICLAAVITTFIFTVYNVIFK